MGGTHTTFRLRFPERDIALWEKEYSYPLHDDALREQRPAVLAAGKLTKPLLQQIADWKSPRSAGRVENNSAAFVEEITAFALSAKDERSRIEALTLLDGVSWPTASVVLHLFHNDLYPIIDFRAIWSLSADKPTQYSFEFWWAYVVACRAICARCGADMRTLDKALWEYSKQQQPS